MRRDLAPLLLVAVRASGGTGAHAAAARQIVLFVLVSQLLADSQHDGPPHASARAPRQHRPLHSRLQNRDSFAGRRPRG
jgi:hypothetical protein